MRTDSEIRRDALELPDVGGGYYEPAEECMALGRKLITSDALSRVNFADGADSLALEPGWDELCSQLEKSEYLFGIYLRRQFNVDRLQAVQIANIERLSDFEFQVAEGGITLLAYVALGEPQATIGALRAARDN
jgi:hypothetical protein